MANSKLSHTDSVLWSNRLTVAGRFEFFLGLVIPNARVFTSARRDLARITQ